MDEEEGSPPVSPEEEEEDEETPPGTGTQEERAESPEDEEIAESPEENVEDDGLTSMLGDVAKQSRVDQSATNNQAEETEESEGASEPEEEGGGGGGEEESEGEASETQAQDDDDDFGPIPTASKMAIRSVKIGDIKRATLTPETTKQEERKPCRRRELPAKVQTAKTMREQGGQPLAQTTAAQGPQPGQMKMKAEGPAAPPRMTTLETLTAKFIAEQQAQEKPSREKKKKKVKKKYVKQYWNWDWRAARMAQKQAQNIEATGEPGDFDFDQEAEQEAEEEEAEVEESQFQYPLVCMSEVTPKELETEMTDAITAACDRYADELGEACKAIKEQFDRLYEPLWHCVIGNSFGYDVTYDQHSIIYMFYYGNLAILVWKQIVY